MKKLLFIIIAYSLLISGGFAQPEKYQSDKTQIKETITGFLNWYKLKETDTVKKPYSILKGGYPDTTTKERIDKEGVEQYLNEFRESGFVSNSYINNFRDYFLTIDKDLANRPKYNDLVKIDGLDLDLVLLTFEPEAILDHINECRIKKCYVIYNKALVKLNISNHLDMLFILTKINKKWIIDYIGHDATDQKSFFKQ